MKKSLYFDEQKRLDEWCDRLLEERRAIAVDTEFMRVRTYFPKLSLIQIGTKEEVACIDPLAIKNLDRLKALLTAPEIIKVFHAPSQDFETLLHTLEILPTPIFDTQIGMHLIAPDKKEYKCISYRKMVELLEGVTLEKDQTRTRWDERPLSPKQIEYAYDDVRYLLECYEKIMAKIHEKGLEKSLQQQHQKYSDRTRFEPNFDAVGNRVKGRQILKGHEMRLLKLIAQSREELAIDADSPRRWIAKDELLIQAARAFVNPKNDPVEHPILNSLPNKTRWAFEDAIQRYHSPKEEKRADKSGTDGESSPKEENLPPANHALANELKALIKGE